MSLLQTAANRIAGSLGRESSFIQRFRPLYELFLECSTAGRGMSWTINGVTYRIDPRQRHRLGHEYDAQVAAFLRNKVKPGSLCINVGANVGVYVLQFAHWSRPSGRVIAFEPNPSAIPILRRHVKLNRLTERVRVVSAAIAHTSGEAVLYAAGADGMSRLLSPNPLLAGTVSPVSVLAMTLDEYCERESLEADWLFMDIEGFEISALMGARNTMARRGPELNLVLELHPDAWEIAGNCREQFEELLTVFRRQVVPLTGQASPLEEHGLVYLPFSQ